ncbi:Copper Transporter integral membrane protein that functions in high affinity copper transport [Agyrium rufum]|nr:Copper Transporter integral membrane protein that functions in high affinity copper transport [Agyrium rufum]
MSMPTTPTASAAMASSTAIGMSMGGMGNNCKISMLWNWYTIDACFLSASWHVTSKSMFAGSCIEVIFLVMALEFLRRVGRDYDAYLIKASQTRQHQASSSLADASSSSGDSTNKVGDIVTIDALRARSQTDGGGGSGSMRPTAVQQAARAAIHMVQFAVAYIIMLLAMYYNGYIIICIFIGAFLGSFVFSWEPLMKGKG